MEHNTNQGLILKSKEEFKPEEYIYEYSDKNMDIGELLNKLNIKPYQKINIVLKEGTYTWNTHYIMPRKLWNFYIQFFLNMDFPKNYYLFQKN